MPSSAVMGKFKSGSLRSGGSGRVVTNPKQAVAIMYSERRAEKANGGKYPEGGLLSRAKLKKRKGR